jgi:pyruvate,water dikinase
MATLAREFRLPTLVGMEASCELPEGSHVTVDATGRAVFDGTQPELVGTRSAAAKSTDEADIYRLLKSVLSFISPLNLIHPDDSDYTPENCRTLHDIVRFTHQRAMEEMFSLGNSITDKDRVAFKLKSDIPLKVLIIYIDHDHSAHGGPREIGEDELASIPMRAFWAGIKDEGWPSRPPKGDVKGFLSVVATGLATNTETDFSESSFALLSQEYMLLSLRMGYHFSTVEAMCSDTVSKNYIRFQCKGGGASLQRRSRRIGLFVELLSRMGFVYTGEGDFIDARMPYQTPAAVTHNLRLLGRITMMTKQLDMALSNDTITRWYVKDILKKLDMADGDGPSLA